MRHMVFPAYKTSAGQTNECLRRHIRRTEVCPKGTCGIDSSTVLAASGAFWQLQLHGVVWFYGLQGAWICGIWYSWLTILRGAD